MSADGEHVTGELGGLMTDPPQGLAGLLHAHAASPLGLLPTEQQLGLIQPNALAALASPGLFPRSLPKLPQHALGLIPVGHRTLREAYRVLFDRLEGFIPAAEGVDNFETIYRLAVLEIGHALHAGEIEGLVFDPKANGVFRVPHYCWSTPFWDLTAEDGTWVGGDLESTILRDVLAGPRLGAYVGRTVFIRQGELDAWCSAVVRRYEERTRGAAEERAQNVQASKARARAEAERQIRSAMSTSPDEQPAEWKKDEARRRLTSDIEGLTGHGFDRAWSAALATVPSCRWSAGGRPPKSGNRNPGQKNR